MKKIYVTPQCTVEAFLANEYVSTCYENGTYSGTVHCDNYKKGDVVEGYCNSNSYSITVSNSRIKSYSVKETGHLVNSEGHNISYNPNTKRLTWDIYNILKGENRSHSGTVSNPVTICNNPNHS